MELRIKEAYLYHLSVAKHIKPCYNSVLLSLLDNALETEQGLMIYVRKSMKDGIAKHLNVTVAFINNAITELAKAEYLIRTERGVYRCNPKLLGTKKWDRFDKIVCAYDYGDGTIQAVFSVDANSLIDEQTGERENLIPSTNR